jgi:hypothetical protein
MNGFLQLSFVEGFKSFIYCEPTILALRLKFICALSRNDPMKLNKQHGNKNFWYVIVL